MIFVTLGTQDKKFERLLVAIDKEIEKGNIKEKVIVQAGFTNYKSDKMEIYDLLDKDAFDKYIKECDLLITHGGVGSILMGLKNNKKVIACPRLFKYNEHINDHQVQIIENFSKSGYLLSYNDGEDLSTVLKKVKTFKPKKFISNNDKIIEIIKDYIEKK